MTKVGMQTKGVEKKGKRETDVLSCKASRSQGAAALECVVRMVSLIL